MPHRPILFALLLLAAVPAAAQRPASTEAWRQDVPCTAGPSAFTVADTAGENLVPGCLRTHCVVLPAGGRVCTCTRDTTVVVRVDDARGAAVHEWPADYALAGSPQSLRVVQGDLDGDGASETIVSELMAVSNGPGVEYHRLSIVDGRDPSQAPVQVNVEDFDPQGSFVRPARGGECRLIATRWTELPDARRGPGRYLVGQWMRYREGRLDHDADRPVVARRLLNSFADARGNTPGAPFAYLRHPDARAHAQHGMGALPALVRTQEGTFRHIRGDTVTVALEPNEVSRHRRGDFYREEDGWLFTTWLVDGVTGRPYPPGYQPADERWLDAVPVRQLTYADGENRTVFLLVIRPRAGSRP